MGKMKLAKETIIISNTERYPGYYLMDLAETELSKASSPGQFVNVLVDGAVHDPLLRIPLGIHGIKKRGISVFYKVVGQATSMLSRKKKNEKIDLVGPLGEGFSVKAGKISPLTEHLIVAGGHGAAPLYALAQKIIGEKGKVHVFLGAGSKKDVVLAAEFRKLGCKVTITTEDGTRGEKGFITCLVRDLLKAKTGKAQKEIEVYGCGPEAMLEALARVVEAEGIKAQVSIDSYMACGIGVCRGCAVLTKEGYKLACKDGPVFYSDEIIWQSEKKGCSL